MKERIMLILLLVTMLCYARAQNARVIKFVHVGDELKPIGTVIISVGIKISLKINDSDMAMDSAFATSIETNWKTFKILEELIKEKKYVTLKGTASNLTEGLKILDSDGYELDLIWPKYNEFFNDLKAAFLKENVGGDIIKAFSRYY